jgi:LAO/AO transport system kinase
VARLLAAFGKDIVVVETVGVGQNEFDIMRLADTVVVVLVPEAGDTIQTMKAGLLEIADLFVVNKADREGAARMKAELELMLQLRPPQGWQVPVLQTVATRGEGVAEVVDAIRRHRRHLEESGEGAARAAASRRQEFIGALRDELVRRLEGAMRNGAVGPLLEQIERGEVDPYAALARVLADRRLFEAVLGVPQRSEP